jgi:HlyD family secretion protein
MDRVIEKKNKFYSKLFIFSIAGLLFVFIGYLFIKPHQSTLLVDQERLMISTVEKGPFQEFIPIIGKIQAINTIFLTAVEGGRVEKVCMQAGAMVRQGDLILKLSNTNLLLDIMYREAELVQQSNNLLSAKLALEQNHLALNLQAVEINYNLKRVKRIFERNDVLFREKLISKKEFEDSEDQFFYYSKQKELSNASIAKEISFRKQQIAELEQAFKRMKNNLALVKQKLENLDLRAPVTGQLTSLDAETGESKSPGQRLGQLDIMDGYKVRADIDEHYIDRVEIGKQGTFELSGENYEVQVHKIYPLVKDGKFEVDLVFKSAAPEAIRRGQTLQIRLNLSDPREAILLPAGGFYQKTGGNWVYVVDVNGKNAQKRSIRIGLTNSQVYEVLSGLMPGEKVITSSYDSFDDYDRLILK